MLLSSLRPAPRAGSRENSQVLLALRRCVALRGAASYITGRTSVAPASAGVATQSADSTALIYSCAPNGF